MGSFTNGGKDARGDRRPRALLGHGSVDNRSLSKGGCLISDRPTHATCTNSPKVLSIPSLPATRAAACRRTCGSARDQPRSPSDQGRDRAGPLAGRSYGWRWVAWRPSWSATDPVRALLVGQSALQDLLTGILEHRSPTFSLLSAKCAPLSERRVIDHAWGAANLRLRCRCLDAPRRGHRFRLALLRRQRRRYHHRFSGNCPGNARCTRSCIGLPSGSTRGLGPRCPRASSLIPPE
jgi:hypothetical protein